nr:NAD(P)-dependent alcohol dehydrogenase [uncultured Actinoplanes sp.]
MKAVVQDVYGDAGVLRLAEIDEPALAEDEVLVRVCAAGVDRGVWHHLTGMPLVARLGSGLRRPRTAVRGAEMSGVVERIGERVTAYAVGDEVFGIGEGTFAEKTRAKVTKIARKPSGISHEQAAACPISAVTALHAVREARLAPGLRVLILGAGGGVGTFAVQLARHRGAEVTGVARDAKSDLVRGLGAGLEVCGRYDAIIDTAGRRPLRTLRAHLTPNGTAVLVGGEGGPGRLLQGFDRQMRAVSLSPLIGQRLVSLMSITKREELDTIAGLLADGSVTPVLDRVFPLADTAAALDYLATGEVRGKVVVTLL